ncbi:MAG TPA: alpha/beta hydrolase [Ktedonobacter sp.]|nr:alpha/beta hydrolase [Ktedonobacter sp.]
MANDLPLEDEEEDFSQKLVVYSLPHMDEAIEQKDIVYKTVNSDDLLMDVYYPSDYEGETRLPAVIFVHGDGPEAFLGNIKDSGQYVSWGQLAAASGLIGITFHHRSTHQLTRLYEVAKDVDDAVYYVRDNHKSLGVNADKLCIWTCSAGSPFGLRTALHENASYIRCIVSYYGIADIATYYENGDETIGEVGRPLPSLTQEVLDEFSAAARISKLQSSIPPMLIVRAGLDDAAINRSIDRLVTATIAKNVSLDFLNHATGHHAFDILDDNVRSREIIQTTLDFMKIHLVEE